ncbi:MAG: redox-sensing transcriptional repressor Rex [Chitinivibrionales bacterium]|nr:redox-sensing transcriptional repressor Rex [Chitinivibrionales bacterium]MBD3397381.1 redox-sensing transcriptional repressor Rex [Chitinivibrionales bacterium]
MRPRIPRPTITRLCILFRLLEDLLIEGKTRISSTELGTALGVRPHSVRKDINYLGEVGDIGSGYDTARLRDRVRRKLGLDRRRNACVVGLGRLGSAILAYERFANSGYTIVAGFDSNINKLETIRTDIELFEAYEISDVVRRKNVEIGVIAVPAPAAQEAADRLIEGGVRGIVNFSPALIRHNVETVNITNMDIVREFTILSAHMTLDRE